MSEQFNTYDAQGNPNGTIIGELIHSVPPSKNDPPGCHMIRIREEGGGVKSARVKND